MGMDLQGRSQAPTGEKSIPNCADDACVRGARAACTQASSAQLGLHFSRVGAFDASLKTARFQRITGAILEPSRCASEVFLMLMMRSSSGFQNHVKSTPYRHGSVSAFPKPSNARKQNRMGGRRHWSHPGKQALASVTQHWTTTARPDYIRAAVPQRHGRQD